MNKRTKTSSKTNFIHSNMNNNLNENVRNMEPSPGTSHQGVEGPLAKRKKSDSEGKPHVDKTISTIVEFFRSFENRHYTAIQDKLMPLLLANFKPDKKRTSLDFTQLNSLCPNMTNYYIRMFRASTSIKFSTEMINRTLLSSLLKNYKNLNEMFIILNEYDHLRDLDTEISLKLRKLKIQGQYNVFTDPVKNLINLNDNGLTACSFWGVKISEPTAIKIRTALLTNISLYDIVFSSTNAKTLLMTYILTNRRIEKLKLVSRQTTGPNPFFRDFALNFLRNVKSPKTEMRRLTFTINQEQVISIDLSFFPNIRKFTFYYTPMEDIENVVKVVIQIKTLIELREISPKRVHAIEYIDWKENIAARRIILRRSSEVQGELLRHFSKLHITPLNINEYDNN